MLAPLLVHLFARSASRDDLQVLNARLVSQILSGVDDPSLDIRSAEKFAESLQLDGSWPDINYTDRCRTGAWQPALHLNRQLSMGAAARLQTNSSTNSTIALLIECTHRAIGFWTRMDSSDDFSSLSGSNTTHRSFRADEATKGPKMRQPGTIHSDNWFWNEYAVPASIADLALVFQPFLNDTQLINMVSIMKRADWKKNHRTGANLVGEVFTQIKRGVSVCLSVRLTALHCL